MIEWIIIGGILLLSKKKPEDDDGFFSEEENTGQQLTDSSGNIVALSDSNIAKTASLTAKQQKIFTAVSKMILNKIEGAHCWDWVYKTFQLAGYGGTSSNNVANFNFVFIGNQYRNTYKSRTISSSNFLAASQLSLLQPGDWLYIHNRNTADAKGNHSVIFLGWKDSVKKIAIAASSPGISKKSGEFRDRDLINNPVAHVMRVKDYT